MTWPGWLTAGRAVCAALLVVFATVLLQGLRYPHDARLFPSIAGAAGLALTLLLLVVDKLVVDKLAVDRPGPEPGPHAPATAARTALALLAAPVYAFLVWLAGFYIASFAVLAVLPWLLGFHRPLILLLFAAGGVALLAGLFAGAMDMSLPQGLLGDWFLTRFVYDQ